jgi:hypothetical protein
MSLSSLRWNTPSLLGNLGSLRFLVFLSKLFSSALEDLVEVILTPSDIGTQASELPLKHNRVSDKSPRSIRRERQTDLAVNLLVPI